MSKPQNAAKPKPQGCTNLKLRQLMRRVTQHYDDEVGKSGLKGTQYSLLSHVVKLGPMRAVDLAAVMKLSTSTLSRNLQPLIAAGWLVIGPGGDARSKLIAATPSGRDKRTQAKRHWRVAQESLNACLGVDKVIALHALLDDVMLRLSPDAGRSQMSPDCPPMRNFSDKCGAG
jgi:DNA-binding MarR family transcriptional regulator